MSEQNSCEFCSNYVYDEEYEEYGCVVNMDEDDLCDYLSLRKTDYLAYKTIDTALKKKIKQIIYYLCNFH